jgi:hypothetical protein
MVNYKESRAYVIIYGINEEDLRKLYNAYDGYIKLKGSAVVGYRLASNFGISVGEKISVGTESTEFLEFSNIRDLEEV